MKPIVLGSRGSPLALAQTRHIMVELKRAWPGRNFEIHVIRTEGDARSEGAEAENLKLGKGLFTGELERALLAGEIDLAVHSLKDLPTSSPEGVMIAAIPKRSDARDVLITKNSTPREELKEGWVTASGSLRRVLLGPELRYGAILATGSPRREAQLRLVRPDIVTAPIRGNIDTRLRKFRENGQWSGLVLAAAGLERLQPDVDGLTVSRLSFSQMLPAPGQGALAIQTRTEGSADVRTLVRSVHDVATGAAVTAERMFLQALGGGCGEPIAAYAEVGVDNLLTLEGIAWLIGETEARRGRLTRRADQAEMLGVDLAVEISR
jgi:hydroxymethylbilane synthase